MSASHKGLVTFKQAAADVGLKAAAVKSGTEIIDEITKSGLKGRAGAGFPTGFKWKLASATKGEDINKFVVCNADEGEPGTFKDRVILNECADLVFEGMTIAARAIGAKDGIVFLRGEYAFLRRRLEETLARRRVKNLLGKSVLGVKNFDFDVEIKMGSGAYICGEETALIETLEGHRGEPRNRPPFPVDIGYFKHGTLVNNVETLCWAAIIMSRGAAWFQQAGTSDSAGYKILSVSGDCSAPGVYEFPMGVTIAELLKEVGGEGAKAVQVGGASGVCVPAREFDRRITFEDAATGGSIIVFGPQRDMLHVAENFLEFFVDESCGQCTPCRLGNSKLLEAVRMLKDGVCSMSYLNEVVSLGETMQLAAKCGLGQSSPNAFLSIVNNFKDEIMGRVSGAGA
ncbi:MAG: NADH-ubiquinone oxidoreductase-F iron-sulfur binding region domain-containing protein [bacterium]